MNNKDTVPPPSQQEGDKDMPKVDCALCLLDARVPATPPIALLPSQLQPSPKQMRSVHL